MTKEDEVELNRLTEELYKIYLQFDPDSRSREALEKAAFALILIFRHKLWPELEEWYSKRESPLTEADRQHLRDLGIDPDGD